MKENYSYPLDYEWTNEEIVIVMNLWQALEVIYEQGMKAEDFNLAYKRFKEVVKSIGEEKRLGKEFEEITGYSLYRTVQTIKKQPTGFIQMKGAVK